MAIISCGTAYRPLAASVLTVLALCISLVPNQRACGQHRMYWTEMTSIYLGVIWRANLDGSDAQLVAFDLYSPSGVAIDPVAGQLYWSERGSGLIVRADLDGSNPHVIVSDIPAPYQLAFDAKNGRLYWTSARRVSSVDRDGTHLEIVFQGDGSPSGIGVDTAAGKVYWTDTGLTERIRRCNLDGTDLETLVEYPDVDLSDPEGLALDPKRGKMYWSDRDRIRRANLDGTVVEDVVTLGVGYPHGIAVDVESAKLYWVDSYLRQIKRANLDGSFVETLVGSNVILPAAIALDLRHPLAPVVATKPANGEEHVSTSPTLEWSPVTDAHQYVVQVFRDSILSQTVFSDTTANVADFFHAPFAEREYYWRVRARQPGESGPWSAVQRFETGSTGPFGVELISPEHETAWVTTSPSFTWHAAPEASHYRLQLFADRFHSEAVALDTTLAGDTSFGPITLEFGLTYDWWVRGQDGSGNGTWSAVRTFTTRDERLEAVTLVSPPDGAGGVPPFATLAWTPVIGATKYHVQLASEPSFASVSLEDSTLTDPVYDLPAPLDYSGSYHWRVRPGDVEEWGSWSTVWSFEVATGTRSESFPAGRDIQLSMYPNPIIDEATVRVEVWLETDAAVTLWDIYGRQVKRVFSGRLAPGTHRFRVRLSRLAAGTYLCRLQVGGSQVTQKVIVVRGG